MARVEAYTLVPEVPSPYLEEALVSVPRGIPHRLIQCRYGEIGRCRAEAMMQAAARGVEYVFSIDHDDVLIHGATEACLTALDSDPSAGLAFTDEVFIDADGAIIAGAAAMAPIVAARGPRAAATHAHHLVVYRLSAVLPHLELMAGFDITCETVLKASMLRYHTAAYVGMVGYKWRQHPAQRTRHQTEADQIERGKMYQMVNPWCAEIRRQSRLES